MEEKILRDSDWLAKRLGISITTVERLRSKNSRDLPPYIMLGRSIRYDEELVESWLASRLKATHV